MGKKNDNLGFVGTVKVKARKVYLNYSMITAVYMMEPLERNIINGIVLVILATILYSSWVYLPHYTLKMLVFCGILSPEGVLDVAETEFGSNTVLESEL